MHFARLQYAVSWSKMRKKYHRVVFYCFNLSVLHTEAAPGAAVFLLAKVPSSFQISHLSKQVAEVFLSPGTSYLRHGLNHNKRLKIQQKISVNSDQRLSHCFQLCNPYSVNRFISVCLIWHLLQAIHLLKTPAMNKRYQPLVDIWLGS